ncbi:MAG: trypsin-like peptidase domain-containing protein [Actinobacteria bacterium]|nr:trypsin-like peptidase domain-containing protein [Actinomycetota bacterium]
MTQVTHDGEERIEDRPMYVEELVEAYRPRGPLGDARDLTLELEVLVAATDEPRIELVSERLDKGKVHCGDDRQPGGYRVRLRIPNASLGALVEPPKVEIERFIDDHDILEAQRHNPGFEAMAPDHLALRPLPTRLPSDLAMRRRMGDEQGSPVEEGEYWATTVFAPDDRYTFRDTAYPWSTVGRVTSPLGSASGVMIGPRHMLTCSHVVQWLPENTAGWIRFAPAFYDGNEPFGAAWGSRIYWEGRKVFGPSISRDEAQHDYVCVVLDRRIGDITGWMGSRSWSDSWDGRTYWSHIGYPGDLGGNRPSYQSNIALDGSFWDREVHTRMFHKADVWPGQSGGPFFGWWSGESGPRVVADQSAHNSDENIAGGGAHMVNCIIRARDEHP